MPSLRDFSKVLNVQSQKIGENVQALVKHVAQNAGVTVIYATPVDTGRARANWQSSVETPETGVLLDKPARPDFPGEGPAIAMASLAAAIAAYEGQEGGIWIANNLDYIQQLNDGSSSQAPADFVAQAVQAGINSIPDIKIVT